MGTPINLGLVSEVLTQNKAVIMENRNEKPENETEKCSTKEKILECAVELFASKGYTETTIREIATAVGIKDASMYNHFPSKEAILKQILDEYSKITYIFLDQKKIQTLKENPTAGNILSCLKLVFPEGRVDYYLKRLYVILQEQHRNPTVRKFVSEKIILDTEKVSETIIQELKGFGVLHSKTNTEFWVKIHSSILYTFASRALLGIGDSEPGFQGIGMEELLRQMYDMMLRNNPA